VTDPGEKKSERGWHCAQPGCTLPLHMHPVSQATENLKGQRPLVTPEEKK
jgi:hypothetical protein